MVDSADAFENQRVQLVQGLNSVAEAMRRCATFAEQYAQLLTDHPEKPAGPAKRKARAMDADGDGTTRKRRVKKPRDPNEPKRPASSYIMFQNDVRKELKSQFPEMSQADLLHMIAKQWSEMTDSQKSVYSQANASAKERYSAEKAAYIATKKIEVEATPATPVAPVKKVAATPKTPKTAPKAAPKSAPVVATSPSESASEESSDDEEEEVDDDDDDEEEEVLRPVPKKAKTTTSPTTAAREKKQSK